MKTSTIRIENPKSFKGELNQIEKINSWNKFKVDLVGHQQIPAKLNKNGKQLLLEIAKRQNHGDTEEKFSFIIDDIVYETVRIDYLGSSLEISLDFPARFSASYKIETFQIKGFNSHGKFRSFYPVDINDIRTFNDEFETVTYQTENVSYGFDCLRINLNGIEYDILQIRNESKSQGFYVLENLGENTLDEFLKASFSIKQALGFINKLMPGDEEYIFDNSGKLYYSNFIRPTLKGMYQPITTNPFGLIEEGRNIAQEYYKKLTRISLSEFSNLVSKIHNDSDFSTAVMVIMEATASRSLLLIPSSFAVIIELLSKAIDTNETEKEVPIDDKELKKKIIKELHAVIDDNSNSLTDDSILKLKRRLLEVNKPINKQHLTNNEKLTRPFEQLSIPLNLNDIEIIEHRNDLLHGNILLRKEDSQTDESINLYMGYVSARLYTLISKLILKSIGYNGYVYNNAKNYERYLNVFTEDEYFELI